jgi:hypothetical protein
MAVDLRRLQNRGHISASEKSQTKPHVSPPGSSSLGWMQALREMALSWEGNKLMPQPPQNSPNHDNVVLQLSAHSSGLHQEREDLTSRSKQQLSAMEKQLQELQQEYKEYRHEMTQRLEQQLGYSDWVAVQNDEYNNNHDHSEAVIVDLQVQLKHQVDAFHKKSAQAAQLDRELKEERRTVERLRHAIHDYQGRFDERQQELENIISRLEKRHVVTTVALQQAQDLVARREKQIAVLESNSASLRKLCGKMQRIVVQRTRHRLDAIQSRLLHPLQQRRRQRRQRSSSSSLSTTANKEENSTSVLSKIKMIIQSRRSRRRRASSSSSNSSKSDKANIVRIRKEIQSGNNAYSKSSSIDRHASRSAVALCRAKV